VPHFSHGIQSSLRRMTRAFLRGKVEKGFSLGQETLAASMFFNERL